MARQQSDFDFLIDSLADIFAEIFYMAMGWKWRSREERREEELVEDLAYDMYIRGKARERVQGWWKEDRDEMRAKKADNKLMEDLEKWQKEHSANREEWERDMREDREFESWLDDQHWEMLVEEGSSHYDSDYFRADSEQYDREAAIVRDANRRRENSSW